MTSRPNIRIPIPATVFLVAVLMCLGWHNHRRLASLQADQRKLAEQATARGIFLDPAHPEFQARFTKRPRTDPTAEAKRVTAGFLAYAKESRSSGDSPDPATRQRMMRQMDQVMALDGEQLQVLIREICAVQGVEDFIKTDLLSFAILRLARDHPKDALTMVVASPELLQLVRERGNSLTKNGISTMVRGWAATDLPAAMEWFRHNGDRLGMMKEMARVALIFSASESDPQIALQFINESGDKPGELAPTLATGYYDAPPEAKSPARLAALLTMLQAWRAGLSDEEVKEKAFDESIRGLALGTIKPEGFDFSTRWIDGANLSPRELESITRGVEQRVIPEETGRWIEWLDKKLPPDIARDRTWHLFTNWSQQDKQAAGQWLANAADSPARNTAIRAYAETIFPKDPATAIQWALSVPAGEERDRTLKRLYDNWPENDPAAKDAFAKAHGIK